VIYRVVGASMVWIWSKETGAKTASPEEGPLLGAWVGQIAIGAWDGLPFPREYDRRVRFWFTERGWRDYGLNVAAQARASGHTFRVLRRKNPPRSMVVYRDAWQVALLPDRRLTDYGC
jgi:hypothetical protein